MCCVIVISIYACISLLFFFFKQKTAYEMRISDWSSDVCSSDLPADYVDSGLRLIYHGSAIHMHGVRFSTYRGNLNITSIYRGACCTGTHLRIKPPGQRPTSRADRATVQTDVAAVLHLNCHGHVGCV